MGLKISLAKVKKKNSLGCKSLGKQGILNPKKRNVSGDGCLCIFKQIS